MINTTNFRASINIDLVCLLAWEETDFNPELLKSDKSTF